MKRGYAYVVADLFHIGHLKHLQNCKDNCDYLIVGVLTDGATMEKKVAPIISYEERAEIVRNIKCVDEVVKQETYSPLENAEKLGVDVLFESESHTGESIAEAFKRIKEVIVTQYHPEQSSTKIKMKIKEEWECKK